MLVSIRSPVSYLYSIYFLILDRVCKNVADVLRSIELTLGWGQALAAQAAKKSGTTLSFGPLQNPGKVLGA